MRGFFITLIVTEIAESRTADNVVNKVEAFQRGLNLPEESLHLTEASSPVRLGEAVVKLGIRTSFTRGQVIEDVALKWNPDSMGPLDPDDEHYKEIPTSIAHGIIGQVEPDGTYLPFALLGDSGSAL
jgi:hypothetical protein